MSSADQPSSDWRQREVPPDLHTQWEDLIETVRLSEANWRFDDRLDLAMGLQPPRRKPAA
jgi:hypothetical protein